MTEKTVACMEYRVVVGKAEAGRTVIELLAESTGLSRVKLKDAMNKGALWRQARGRSKFARHRKATFAAENGDRFDLYFDAAVLGLTAPVPELIHDGRRYSIWNKPAGMLSQGTRSGDHCALLRFAETHFTPRRPVWLVHRLDREASGLMLIAHDKGAAAAFSQLFQGGEMIKHYRAAVRGLPCAVGDGGLLAGPLDGKAARTEYRVAAYDPTSDISLLLVTLFTGRKHQIRRHLAGIGHAVLGDPCYGKDNSFAGGLQLESFELAFTCPFTGKARNFRLAASGLIAFTPPNPEEQTL